MYEFTIGPLYQEVFLTSFPPHVRLRRLNTTQWLQRDVEHRSLPDIGNMVNYHLSKSKPVPPHWISIVLDPVQMSLDLPRYLPFYVTCVQHIVPRLSSLQDLPPLRIPVTLQVLRNAMRHHSSVLLLSKILLKHVPPSLYWYRNGHIRHEQRPPTHCSWKGCLIQSRTTLMEHMEKLGPVLLITGTFYLEVPPNVTLCTIHSMCLYRPADYTVIINIYGLSGMEDFRTGTELQDVVSRCRSYIGFIPDLSIAALRTHLFLMGARVDTHCCPNSVPDILDFVETMHQEQCFFI
jgi:hypothetical protein